MCHKAKDDKILNKHKSFILCTGIESLIQITFKDSEFQSIFYQIFEAYFRNLKSFRMSKKI